ncbi:MAG: hypothetical protein LBD89_08220 [Tannerellaceae bacterium]|jgi:hypothetical protein|nr:hypothetical protein [Tannerellaceae bacterium]
MKSTYFFTFFCCITLASAYAQSSSLEGTWRLENASAVRITGSDTVEVAIHAIKHEVSDMLSEILEFKADRLSLGAWDAAEDCRCGRHGTYALTGNRLTIAFTAAPITVNYRIENGKLYFMQQYLLGMEPPYTYRVSTVYSKQP